MSGRGLAGLAAAGLAVCCGLPLLLAAGSAVTFAGLGFGSWLLIAGGCVIAAAGAWRWRVHRRACGPQGTGTTELPALDTAVRRAAFDALRRGAAPTLDELAQRSGRSVAEVAKAVAVLAHIGRAQVEGARVVAADGLSSRPTRHRLTLEGVALHTWCALDAVGIPAALRADGAAHTACPRCGRVMHVRFDRGRPLAGDAVVVWVPEKRCSSVVEEFCPDANLFCGRNHLEAWRREAGEPPGRALSLTETAELGRQVWADVTVRHEAGA